MQTSFHVETRPVRLNASPTPESHSCALRCRMLLILPDLVRPTRHHPGHFRLQAPGTVYRVTFELDLRPEDLLTTPLSGVPGRRSGLPRWGRWKLAALRGIFLMSWGSRQSPGYTIPGEIRCLIRQGALVTLASPCRARARQRTYHFPREGMALRCQNHSRRQVQSPSGRGIHSTTSRCARPQRQTRQQKNDSVHCSTKPTPVKAWYIASAGAMSRVEDSNAA